MVMGFELGTKDRLINKTDYSTVIKVEGTVANVNLPGDFTPIPFGNELIGYDFSQHNIKGLSCEFTAPQIVEEWARLR